MPGHRVVGAKQRLPCAGCPVESDVGARLEGLHGAEILIPGLAELAFDHHGLGGEVDIVRRVPGGRRCGWLIEVQ